MAAQRAQFRRPEPAVAAGITLVTTGLVVAVVLGNTIGSPSRSGTPGTSGFGGPTASGVAGASPSGSPPIAPTTASPAPSVTAGTGAVGWRPLAWSRAGRYLAVAQDVSDGVDLGLLVPGVSEDPVTIVRHVDERSVQWSADGQHLVAVATDELGSAEVVLVTLTGDEAAVEPLGSGAVATWSPDGVHVLVVNPEQQLLAYAIPAGSRPRASLAAPTVLANDADPRCPPAWTPESLISYCRSDGTLVMVPAP